MEIIFGLGLVGLLGAYLFLHGYVFLLSEMRDNWGPTGLTLGLVPVLQWVWALGHPRRGLAPLASQLVGLVLMTPSFAAIWFIVQLFGGNVRIG